MSQHDMIIDNGPGAAVRSDINAAIAALVSNSSGPVEPTVTYAGQFWLDTGVTPNVIRLRNAANSGWTTAPGTIPGGDAPSDSKIYGRRNALWTEVISDVLPRGHIDGFTLSNDAGDLVNDIRIKPGAARDSTNTADIVLAADLIKRVDAAWVAGTNQGGRTGTALADGWWHVYAIKDVTNNIVDVVLDSSGAGPSLPSGYTKYRLLGSVNRISGAFQRFIQTGDYFGLLVPINIRNGATFAIATSIDSKTPIGRKCRANIYANLIMAAGPAQTMINDPDTTDVAVDALNCNIRGMQSGAGANGIGDAMLQIYTNTLSQLRERSNAAGATLGVQLFGWYDDRGRNA